MRSRTRRRSTSSFCSPGPRPPIAAFERDRPGIAAAHQSREQVLELRELDLDLAFVRAGAAGEDVEDELRAVDDLSPRWIPRSSRLRRREVLVDDDVVGLKSRGEDDQVFEAASAHQCARVELLTDAARCDRRRPSPTTSRALRARPSILGGEAAAGRDVDKDGAAVLAGDLGALSCALESASRAPIRLMKSSSIKLAGRGGKRR
jgi:hypothetical protein